MFSWNRIRNNNSRFGSTTRILRKLKEKIVGYRYLHLNKSKLFYFISENFVFKLNCVNFFFIRTRPYLLYLSLMKVNPIFLLLLGCLEMKMTDNATCWQFKTDSAQVNRNREREKDRREKEIEGERDRGGQRQREKETEGEREIGRKRNREKETEWERDRVRKRHREKET